MRRRTSGRSVNEELTLEGFFLLAMISLSLFYTVKHHVHNPDLQERLIRALLIPLAIADIIQ